MRHLVTIFTASASVNLNVIVKISDAESQLRIYYVFDKGDHPTAVKCLPIAVENCR